MLNLSYAFDDNAEVLTGTLQLASGSCLLDVLQVLQQRYPTCMWEKRKFGVWGVAQDMSYLLKEGDRIEAWRELLMDPKEARRLRALKKASKA